MALQSQTQLRGGPSEGVGKFALEIFFYETESTLSPTDQHLIPQGAPFSLWGQMSTNHLGKRGTLGLGGRGLLGLGGMVAPWEGVTSPYHQPPTPAPDRLN